METTDNRSSTLRLVRSLIVLGLIVVAVAALAPSILNTVQEISPTETTHVECIIGSEKSGFLDNQEVKDILAREYGLDVSYRRMGSIEQATTDLTGVDCLWPSNTSALEIFRENNPELFASGTAKSEIIFNSPIVIYAWRPITSALEDAGLVTEAADGRKEIDTAELMTMLTSEDKPSWADLGVTDLFGDFNVVTTDPTRSNSGNMFYALMANMLVDGDIATMSNIVEQLPTIKTFYDAQGRLEESSGILFEQFITLGMGAYPAIANYESLLIELAVNNPEQADAINSQIQIIYPVPTVWSSHPLIALNNQGKSLLDAMQDERLQRIAWEQHGFRSGLTGIQNDVTKFAIPGLASEVNAVIALPRSNALLEMLGYLDSN
ncbi:MAG: substrate-binding domain-containing protein [Anaerolineae bacterium]|nr:substrate-binding domain-containing protein [Anaerolineae bacterium]MCA9886910.1 substrate-binding domain-containing protein [Anaerolineae bacterium]MCA9895198.1 substrate-binding domain-containing protein [Anaerolineae bacterium]MCB9461200.1 substrate-binding domain-containing protein [Anaerolineaceae bacterium]